MPDQELEGTWEEVMRHSPQLKGHRVKVIVLDKVVSEEAALKPKKRSLEEALDGLVGTVDLSDAPDDLASRTHEIFANIMAEQYQQP